MDLFAIIENTCTRSYRIGGHLVYQGGGRTSIHPFDLSPGLAGRIYIGTDGVAFPDHVDLHYSADCPCGRADTNGHWPRVVPVPPARSG